MRVLQADELGKQTNSAGVLDLIRAGGSVRDYTWRWPHDTDQFSLGAYDSN